MKNLDREELILINGGETIYETAKRHAKKAYSWVRGFIYGWTYGDCPEEC